MRVTDINVTEGGFGYTKPPTITLHGPGEGRGASASAEVVDGKVAVIYVDIGGCGYTEPPLVFISSDGGGSSAAAVAVLGTGDPVPRSEKKKAAAPRPGPRSKGPQQKLDT